MGEWAEDEMAAAEMDALDRAMGWDNDRGSECPACKGKGKVNKGDLLDCKLCDGEGEI